MVTTHDLALTEIAAIFPGEARNVHLQDHVEDGKMSVRLQNCETA